MPAIVLMTAVALVAGCDSPFSPMRPDGSQARSLATRGWLQAWIIDAQALEPGSKMPSLKSFDGETLNALTAYLESLQ